MKEKLTAKQRVKKIKEDVKAIAFWSFSHNNEAWNKFDRDIDSYFKSLNTAEDENLTAEQEDKLMFSEWERIRLPDGEGTSLGYFRAGWACCKLNANTAEDELEDES